MFDNVLVGVDGRQGGRDAIALARQLAAPEARLTLAHVYGSDIVLGRGGVLMVPALLEDSRRLQERERAEASLDAELVSSGERSVGPALHELAELRDADLLVVGSCHRGVLGRMFLGDDTRAALNGAPCAVAIAPAGYAASADAFSVLGVGYDGSDESEQALAVAQQLAARNAVSVKARAVVSLQSLPYGEPIPDDWPEVVRQLMDDEQRRLNGLGDVEGDVTYGEPSEELDLFGVELDLLIVGSHSYGPIGRMLNGSTSNYLARRARCPLLVVPRSARSGDERTGRDSGTRVASEAGER